MSKNLEIKKQVVADIIEKFKSAKSVVVCSFNGLTVEQVTQLRKNCRENNVHYCVLKNRLVARALKELNIEGLDSLLEGPNAFVFGEKDVTADNLFVLRTVFFRHPIVYGVAVTVHLVDSFAGRIIGSLKTVIVTQFLLPFQSILFFDVSIQFRVAPYTVFGIKEVC